jgi:L-rhamnose mutarotase
MAGRTVLPADLEGKMERVAFVMRVKAGQQAEYRRRHEAVWPEMLRALKAAGCSNYSIFMRGRDLFAYMEVDDFARFKRVMSANVDAQRWEAQMTTIMERAILPETGFHELLPEVFHLD